MMPYTCLWEGKPGCSNSSNLTQSDVTGDIAGPPPGPFRRICSTSSIFEEHSSLPLHNSTLPSHLSPVLQMGGMDATDKN